MASPALERARTEYHQRLVLRHLTGIPRRERAAIDDRDRELAAFVRGAKRALHVEPATQGRRVGHDDRDSCRSRRIQHEVTHVVRGVTADVLDCHRRRPGSGDGGVERHVSR